MKPNTPNLAQDLIRIHKVITRALNVDLTKGIEYLQIGFSSPQAQLGYTRYTHCLSSVLGSHHQGEDLIAFPAFRKVIPSAPYAQLLIDHHAIEVLLAVFPQAIRDLSSDAQHNGLRGILSALQKILVVWEPHIQLEEEYFSKEAFNAVFDMHEQVQISEATSKYSQEHSGPPYWAVPFILFNLDPDDRATMAANFSPAIMDEFILKVWKDQWAPMKPLLLD
jgi:hypothetical protein